MEDTDVVGVESIEGSTYLRRPATTLGQISRPPRPTPASVSAGRPDLSRIPDPRPVVNLYFDPFSSYAPTYDSSDANLSYVSSARYLTSQESAGELASQSLLARTYSDAVDASSASVPQNEDPTQGAADVDDLLAKHLNLGSKADLERMLEAAPSEWESTEGTLRSISTILFDLQLSQLDRLRQQAIQMRTLPLADLHCPNGKASTVKLSELEAAQAAEVLEKLTQLAAAVQPKHLTQASERDSLARALKAPFLEARDDPAALAPSFSGTLPADHAGVLRENLLTVCVPADLTFGPVQRMAHLLICFVHSEWRRQIKSANNERHNMARRVIHCIVFSSHTSFQRRCPKIDRSTQACVKLTSKGRKMALLLLLFFALTFSLLSVLLVLSLSCCDRRGPTGSVGASWSSAGLNDAFGVVNDLVVANRSAGQLHTPPKHTLKHSFSLDTPAVWRTAHQSEWEPGSWGG